MHTPTHAVVNLALLGRRDAPERTIPIFAGAIAPDAVNAALYAWCRFAAHLPDDVIWRQRWPSAWWQAIDAPAHSLVVAAALFALGRWRRWTGLAWFAASMFAHSLLDLPFHGRDAHRHLWPLSNWRWQSPLSYWDRAHHATLVEALEIGLLVAASAVLWTRHRSALARVALVVVNVAMIAAWRTGMLFWGT